MLCSMLRYLASGADDSSVWLEAKCVEGHNVICEANNATELSGAPQYREGMLLQGCLILNSCTAHKTDSVPDTHAGLLTVLHAEQGGNGLNPTNLPLLSEHDESAIRCRSAA